MSEEMKGEAAPVEGAKPQAAECQSPPAAPMAERETLADPRAKLLQLAGELMRSHNRRLVIEYLRLRRAIA